MPISILMDTLYKLAKDRISEDIFISSGNRRLSYSDFFLNAKNAKNSLKQLHRGDILMCHFKSKVDFLSHLFASLELGVHFLPVYEHSTDWEKSELRKKICPHWEILDNGLLRPLYLSREKLSLSAGVIFQTSGSLGPSRFIYQSQENLLNNAIKAKKYQSIDVNSKVFIPLTLSHSGGLNMQTLSTFIGGGGAYLANGCRHFDLMKIFQKKFSHALLIPSQFRLMTDCSHWVKSDFAGELTILTGSCPVPKEFYYMARKQGVRLLGVYGLTEIGPFVSVMDSNLIQKEIKGMFPIGRSVDGFSLRLSSDGEIMVKGPCTGKYIVRRGGKDWKIKDCGNPWVSTGDKGLFKDSLLYLGRKKREINISGFKINPEEIEEILRGHPKVEDCLVFGQKDKKRHEVPHIKVVAEGSSILELKKFLMERISAFKIPRKWFFVKDLGARTSIGKAKVG